MAANLIDENDLAIIRQRVASIKSQVQSKVNEIESGLDYIVSLKTNELVIGTAQDPNPNAADYIAGLDSLIGQAQTLLQNLRDKYN